MSGKKTAVKLIKEYGSIPKLYENIDELPKTKMKEKLIRDKDVALLSRELVTIDIKVPVSFTLDDLQFDPKNLYDNEELLSILDELEFKSFVKKLSRRVAVSTPAETNQNTTDDSGTQEVLLEKVVPRKMESLDASVQLDAFMQLMEQADKTRKIAIAIITGNGGNNPEELPGIALASSPSTTLYINWKDPDEIRQQEKIISAIQTLFQSRDILVVLHDWKQVLKRLNIFGIHKGENILDVMLAAHLVESDERDYGILGIFQRQLQYQKIHLIQKGRKKKGDTTPYIENEVDYYLSCCEDAGILWQLSERLINQLDRKNLLNTYEYLEKPLAEVLSVVETNGVKIDSGALSLISEEFEERINELSQEIYHTAEETFNINSVVELQQVLYDKLNVHNICKVKPKKIKLGNKLSTDEETLEKMNSHPLPRLILKYRELNKLKNTYVDQLPTFVNQKTGKIHSSFRQTVAATGRLASDNPNLQNIPVRTEEGRRIRSVFIPEKTGHVLISADYSQIELRVIAHFSKDPSFISAYRENLDIHRLTASTIFEVTEEEVTSEMRSKAKEVNFGLIYRMGPERLALITQTQKTDAKKFIERYFDKYATIHNLQEKFIETARKQGYAETLLGRRRYLPAINGRGLPRRLAEGAAINTPIQGSAADIIKLAMIAIQKKLDEQNLATKMILTVHDELVFDAPLREKETICQLVKYEMENVIVLQVPLVVDVGVGANWLKAH